MSRSQIGLGWIGIGIACLVLPPTAAAQILLCDRVSNQILEYNTDGSFRRTVVGLGSTLPDGPSGMAFGNGSDLFVTSINDGYVLRYNWKTGDYLGIFATLRDPLTEYSLGPSGVLFDRTSNSLYVSEFGSMDGHAVVRYDATSGAETGRFDPGSGGGYADMALGADAKLYVSNFYASQVLRFDPTNAAAPPVVFASDPALRWCNGLSFDSSGKLDVVGLYSQNVFQFNADGTSVGELIPAASQTLYFPSDAVLDPDGNLLVSNLGNNSDPGIPYAPGYIGKYNATTGAPLNPFFIFEISGIQPTAMLIESYAVWSGGATGETQTYWTQAANWNGSPPVDPAAIRFGAVAAGGHLANDNDFDPGTQFNGITFAAGAPTYTLTGHAVKLGGPVVNQSESNQTIDLDMELVLGGGSFDTGAHNITVNGDITGDGSLTKKGSGTLSLAGNVDYTGSTTVIAGALEVAGALSSPEITVAGDGTQLTAKSITADTLTICATTYASGSLAVPEPSAIILLMLGGLGLIAFQLRRRKQ